MGTIKSPRGPVPGISRDHHVILGERLANLPPALAEKISKEKQETFKRRLRGDMPGVQDKLNSRFCGYCGFLEQMKPNHKFRLCGKCKSVYYCSEECQKLGWK